MTGSPNYPTAVGLVAAAGSLEGAVALLGDAEQMALLLDLITDQPVEGYVDTGASWTATVTKVTRVTKGDDPERQGHKAVIHLDSTDQDGNPESFETGWLSGRLAMLCAQTAKAAIGQRCRIYKRNRADPTGDSSQGFRTVVWVQPLASAPVAAGQGREAVRGAHVASPAEYVASDVAPDHRLAAEGAREARQQLADRARSDVESDLARAGHRQDADEAAEARSEADAVERFEYSDADAEPF